MAEENQNIAALMVEERQYPPDPEFTAQANAKPGFYEQDPDAFWEKEGRDRLSWFTDFTTLKEWDRPYARWYLGGKLNACYNCVDRHVENGLGDKVAYHWEGEPVGDKLTITYADLQSRVVRAANGFKSLGIGKGTKVAVYMGMIPEAPVTLLALARIGAPFTFVFGGFSANALGSRMAEMECEYLVTQDAANRRGKAGPLKPVADQAMDMAPTVKTCVTVRRTGTEVELKEGRDRWWHDVVDGQDDDPASCPCEPMDSEDMFFLMFSSGTTGKPKGIVHSTAGYLAGVSTTHYYVFDIKPDTVYWCAADIGWITGHSYIVFGPLVNATTSVMYEGTPDFPDKDRWWDIIERYQVNVLYTAPTSIRTHMKWGDQYAARHDLSSLKVLGSVGEPINPEAWVWYREHIGGGKAPVVDTWWQTENGMILVTPLPGITTLKPGSATRAFPGVQAAVYDESGREIPPGEGAGYMVVKEPWPAMFRGLYNDDQRFKDTYWSTFPDAYLAGDGARVDEDGDFWLMGRIDDVMNVSGHRLSTIEIESALVNHPDVAQAAVVSRSDATTGQAIVAYVTLKDGARGTTEKLAELREHVGTMIGPIAKPANVVFAAELPMTRSGKIMRRLLKDVAENRALGDTTTLADPTVVEEIKARAEAGKED
ncbi:MAG: acetate--CoA ligase [Intrasporangium sp.]|uniref:acetate--CoA ligase n=1 Tax=Intrasporangium sp. TaxID=1925024 RepID=UPI002648CDF9|nr:acetate--CoA ligase [Intrasporangium sp.]MDN5794578.1 acetate--CoA ligase [Intrasporangium sp.]